MERAFVHHCNPSIGASESQHAEDHIRRFKNVHASVLRGSPESLNKGRPFRNYEYEFCVASCDAIGGENRAKLCLNVRVTVNSLPVRNFNTYSPVYQG